MNASELEAAGFALFGPKWRTQLAKALDVDKSTLRRWIANDCVPEIVELALDGLHARGGFLYDTFTI